MAKGGRGGCSCRGVGRSGSMHGERVGTGTSSGVVLAYSIVYSVWDVWRRSAHRIRGTRNENLSIHKFFMNLLCGIL